MMTIEFENDGTTLTVRPEGTLNSVTAPELDEQMVPQIEGMNEVILDLAKVEYISSAGLRVLVATDQAMEKRGGCMKIIHAGPYILEILDMTGLLNAFTVVGDQ